MTYKPFNPGPQVDVFAFDLLRVLFTHGVLLRSNVSLVSPPPIRVKPRDPKRLWQCLQLQKDGILASPKDVGQHVSTVMIDRVPSPVWLRFLPHVTPHFIEL